MLKSFWASLLAALAINLSACATTTIDVAGIQIPTDHICGQDVNDYCVPGSNIGAYHSIDLTEAPYDIGVASNERLYQRLGTAVLNSTFDPTRISCTAGTQSPFNHSNASIRQLRQVPSFTSTVSRNRIGGASASLDEIFRLAAIDSNLNESIVADFSARAENIDNIEATISGELYIVEINDDTIQRLRFAESGGEFSNCAQLLSDNPGVAIVSKMAVFRVASLSLSQTSRDAVSAQARAALTSQESSEEEARGLALDLVNSVIRQYSASAQDLHYALGVATWPNTAIEAREPLQWTRSVQLESGLDSSRIAVVRDPSQPVRIQVCNHTPRRHGNLSAHNVRLVVDGEEVGILHAFGPGAACSEAINASDFAEVYRYETSSVEDIDGIQLKIEVRRLNF